tara:strand:- start:1866 stop:2276 length:411 start_codon:yes stop_codon:yes gene_type:complete
MEKNKIKIAGYSTLISAVGLTLSGCGKYDDGPGFSLRTKKARLVGEWEAVQMGNEVLPQNGYGIEWEFEKDGDFKFTYNYGTYSYSYSGDWEFSSDKEDIEIEFDGTIQDFEIKRLTNKELWLEDPDNQEWKFEAL